MNLAQLLYDLFFDYTLRTVALGSALLGIISGTLGAYAVLRKQSLLGDAISHAALPGIAVAFLLTGSKAPLALLIGAAIAGWLGTLLVNSVVRNTHIKDDSALGIVLAVFFGFGLVLLTYIQKHIPTATQAGLNKFLFGQAAALLERDVITMAIIGGIVLVLVGMFWKELKLLTFDREFAASQGFPTRALDILLTTLLVVAIVIGLQTVGVVLMSAMVVAPAAAARQWTDRLGRMIFLSATFGALAGVFGALLSSSVKNLPTGPTIVLCASALVLISMLFAPNRGLLWGWFRRRQNRHKLHLDAQLHDLYTLALQHNDPEHAHSIVVLRAMAAGRGGVRHSLEELAKLGLARHHEPDSWSLTPKGYQVAQQRFNDPLSEGAVTI